MLNLQERVTDVPKDEGAGYLTGAPFPKDSYKLRPDRVTRDDKMAMTDSNRLIKIIEIYLNRKDGLPVAPRTPRAG